jgi:hypothetical protein
MAKMCFYFHLLIRKCLLLHLRLSLSRSLAELEADNRRQCVLLVLEATGRDPFVRAKLEALRGRPISAAQASLISEQHQLYERKRQTWKRRRTAADG